MGFSGAAEPIVVDRRSYRIVGGHQRVYSAQVVEIEPADSKVTATCCQNFTGIKAEGRRHDG